MKFQDVCQLSYVQDLIRSVCGGEIEVIERPAAYFIRNVNEGERKVERLIFLPPRGYTANTPDQMNSHDEAEFATIEIKGAAKDGKGSFSVLKNCVFIPSISKNGMVSELNEPYLTYDLHAPQPYLDRAIHSAGTSPFYVVRPDGYGFYHNIVNITDEWLVMKLVKTMRPQKSVDLPSSLKNIAPAEAALFETLFAAVQLHGDEVFTHANDIVEQVYNIALSTSLPVLSEMLYVHDTGKHEACTVFAMILKLGKQYPVFVVNFLRNAAEQNQIPGYYASQLVEKIKTNVTKSQQPTRQNEERA